ncbi:MAG: YceD family protein [Gammaproteobacteria bacterium]
MHKDNLPLRVDPFRFAENATRLNGTLLIKDMQRLCTSLSNQEGGIDVNMEFGVDEQGIRFVKGQLKTRLMLQCQRCLEPFEYEIIGGFQSGIVHTEEEADKLPERYDPLVVNDGALILSDLIEEELIISLPLVPMHNTESCNAQLYTNMTSSAERESPFKVIESLRSTRNK